MLRQGFARVNWTGTSVLPPRGLCRLTRRRAAHHLPPTTRRSPRTRPLIARCRGGSSGSGGDEAVVALETRVGPLVVVLGPGLGLHALDVVLIVGGVSLAAVLLRYAERLDDELEDEARPGLPEPWWRFWERWP